MMISQAIYASADADIHRGYHLVSRSPRLDEQVAHSLCRWSPSHGCLSEAGTDAVSLNFFQPLPDWYALSRSVYGCPEYSQRGGLQVVTMNLVFHASQLARLENDVVACFKTALSTGLLTLPLFTPRVLPEVDFPEPGPKRTAERFQSSEIRELLQSGRQVAFLGAENPLAWLDGLINSTAASDRLEMSFATGLKPSAQRPFRIQFFRSATAKLKHDLVRQGFCVKERDHRANALCPELPALQW